MQNHRVRKIPVIDEDGLCVDMVSQADPVRLEQPNKVYRTVAEISRPAQDIVLNTAIIKRVRSNEDARRWDKALSSVHSARSQEGQAWLILERTAKSSSA